MFIKSILAIAFAASVIAPASASVVYNIEETFASGAVFTGALTFTDDFKHLTAVDGLLNGASYDSRPVTWLWWNGTEAYSIGANYLMSGVWPSYDTFVNVSWDFSQGPALSLARSGGVGNSVGGWDQSTGGTLTAASAVPEPGSIALLALGFLGVAASRRKPAKSGNA